MAGRAEQTLCAATSIVTDIESLGYPLAYRADSAVRGYSIVQDCVFHRGADRATAEPVDTHIYLESGEEDEAAQQTLRMREQTCFLHAAMRDTSKTRMSLRLNGVEMAPAAAVTAGAGD